MIVLIPAKFIDCITFPGVLLHEVAHQLMCDLCNVPIYSVEYFTPNSHFLGCVVHAPANSYYKELCIGIAPLLINSLVCMLFTLPIGTTFLFGTTFLDTNMGPLQFFVSWIGFSSGFHAFPSKQDTCRLAELATTPRQKRITHGLQAIINICNLPNLSLAFSVGYTCLISLIIPFLFFS